MLEGLSEQNALSDKSFHTKKLAHGLFGSQVQRAVSLKVIQSPKSTMQSSGLKAHLLLLEGGLPPLKAPNTDTCSLMALLIAPLSEAFPAVHALVGLYLEVTTCMVDRVTQFVKFARAKCAVEGSSLPVSLLAQFIAFLNCCKDFRILLNVHILILDTILVFFILN